MCDLAALADTCKKWAIVYTINVLTFLRKNAEQYAHTRSKFDQIEDWICLYLLYEVVHELIVVFYGYGPIKPLVTAYKYVVRSVTRFLLKLPLVHRKVQAQIDETRVTIETQFVNKPEGVDFSEIPAKGLSARQLKSKLDILAGEEAATWQGGQYSGAVYYGNEAIAKLQADTYREFSFANQLHPDAFPSVRQMEAEVVSMVLKLFHAPDSGCGTTTSGGTESLLLACLAAREKAAAERGVSEPEIIAPVSIHAAVFKAAKYFKKKLRLVDLTDDFTVDIGQVKRLINCNTCLLMGSAPNFPYGTVDNIQALSDIAISHNLPLHVDCCLGSFVIAYYSKVFKEALAPFDFALPGVTSISCDTHKYGFTPKGSSVIMYRDPSYRKYQYFITSEWVGGLYGSPTLAGSRPGAITAGTWATMLSIGDDGYKKSCAEIIEASRKLRDAIENDIPELDVVGDPKLSVVAFKSDQINVHTLNDILSKRGWHLSALQKPPSVHLCVTRLSVPVIDKLITDLKECASELADRNEKIESDTAQLYGVANSLTVNSVADDIIGAFLDVLYQDKRTE